MARCLPKANGAIYAYAPRKGKMPLRRDLGRPRTLPAKGFRPNRINLHEKYDYPELERPVLRALPAVAPDLLPDGTRDEHVIAIPERPAVRYPDRSMAQAGAH
ncbi:MAG: hypothetical protein LW847_07645, partial [Burkholderiales bacterium]|nr:hypothetical protein [Burkholderiales bacterium]